MQLADKVRAKIEKAIRIAPIERVDIGIHKIVIEVAVESLVKRLGASRIERKRAAVQRNALRAEGARGIISRTRHVRGHNHLRKRIPAGKERGGHNTSD